jgi:hypothetical protein
MKKNRLEKGRLSLNSISKSLLFFIILFQLIFMNSMTIFAQQNLLNDGDFNTRASNSRSGDWNTMQLWTDSAELNTVAIGDVDTSHPGDEVVVAGNSNKVTVISGFGTSWAAETVYIDDWVIASVAIGDVYPPHPGNEIVIVGWSTWVTMIYKDEESDKWLNERLYQDYDWLYDVAIGDLDPTHPGNEIVFGGDPRHLLMLNYSEETDTWSSKTIWKETPADINVIAIGDFDATHTGNECAVAGVLVKELNLTEVSYNYTTGSWDIANIGEVEKEPLEMVCGEFYTGHPGDELALVSIERNILMIYQDNNNNWVLDKIWEDTESIRDIEIIDILPQQTGNELIVVGYSNSATIIHENSSTTTGWEATRIFTTNANLFTVAVGEFDALHSGNELAVIQSGGKLLKLQFETTRFNVFMPNPEVTIPAGSEITVPVIVSPEADFSSQVTAAVSNNDALLNDGISIEIELEKLIPPELIELQVSVSQATPMQSHIVQLKCSTPSLGVNDVFFNFTINVLSKDTPAYNMTISPLKTSVVVDHSTSIQIKINEINNWNRLISLGIKYLPPGITYLFKDPALLQSPTTTLTLTTTSATPVGEYFIPITAKSGDEDSYYQTSVLKLSVHPPEPDYYLIIDSNILNITINGTNEIKILGFSRFGFDEKVTFEFQGLPEGVSVSTEPESIIPTGNFTATFEAKFGIEITNYTITVIGTSENTGLQRQISFQLIVHPEPPGFEISLVPDKDLKVKKGKIAELKLTITPGPGFNDQVYITINGLRNDMTWNQELSPIHLKSQETVSINISGLDTPSTFDLTIKVDSENTSKELPIFIEIYDDEESTKPAGINEMAQILIVIIILLIILISLYKFTKRLPSRPIKLEEEKPKKRKKRQKKSGKKSNQ